MCGIAGFAGGSLPLDAAAHRVRAMCDAIRHRGPDADGYFVAEGIALGMRRLSIIDVSGGQQPITNEDGTVTVVFNGEIYNHRMLRRGLETAGHRFRTHSDTEVLVHLYEDFGPDMVKQLQGMFAFAIWDSTRRTLFIARDRSGMKPLSYVALEDGLAFCSELRSLMAVDDQLVVSPSSVVQYLAFGYVPDPATIFEGVRKLPPGHTLTWSAADGVVVRRYWSAPRPSSPPMDEAELVEALRTKLDKAVASHLEAEVPLGAFLSGGLDSTTVVALMSRHATGRVRTFSIGFAAEEFDESPAAREAAQVLGTEHSDLILRPDVDNTFEAIAQMFDEPFADSSAIPTYFVARLARQSVTVSLSGDAGDELFGGYSRYREILGHGGISRPFVQRLSSVAGLLLPHVFPGRNRLVDLGRTRWGRFASTVLQPVRTDEGGVARTILPGANKYLSEWLGEELAAGFGDDFAAAMMQTDFATYLPGDILTKVDRTTMAVSLEARVPLLDFDLVDFALGLPGELRVTAAEGKRLFRRAIRGLVPDAVLNRPKRGFEVPLGRWFRGPLRHRIEALRNSSAHLAAYVDPAAMNRLVSEHAHGRRDHSGVLWRLIVLDCWLAAFEGKLLGRPPSLPDLPVA